MIFMKLGGRHYAAAPAIVSEALPVAAFKAQQARVLGSLANEQCRKGRLAAPGAAFQQDPISRMHRQATLAKDRISTPRMTECQVLHPDYFAAVLGRG